MSALHPATWIMAWMILAVTLPWVDGTALLLLSAGVAGITMRWGIAPIVRMLRRLSILLPMLLLVYALATPGTPVWSWAPWPTIEGLRGGGLQVWRLALLVSILALILARLDRTQLLAAIYTLMQPFKTVGLPVERIAVRLSLVLHYVDTTPVNLSWHERLDRVRQIPSTTAGPLEIDVPVLRWRDFGTLIVVSLTLVWLAW